LLANHMGHGYASKSERQLWSLTTFVSVLRMQQTCSTESDIVKDPR
jgi:hypothetical protein